MLVHSWNTYEREGIYEDFVDLCPDGLQDLDDGQIMLLLMYRLSPVLMQQPGTFHAEVKGSVGCASWETDEHTVNIYWSENQGEAKRVATKAYKAFHIESD